jgi:hypothetical protein
MLLPLYPRGKNTRYPLDRRLGEPLGRSGQYGEVEMFYPTGNRTPTPRPARSQSLRKSIKEICSGWYISYSQYGYEVGIAGDEFGKGSERMRDQWWSRLWSWKENNRRQMNIVRWSISQAIRVRKNSAIRGKTAGLHITTATVCLPILFIYSLASG